MSKTEKGYVSYGIESDDIYDAEGDVIGTDDYYLIDLVYVAPEYRGHGVARQLLRDAIAEIRAISDLPIRLAALPKEDGIELSRLVSFYESEGFEAMDEQGGAAVVMEYGRL